MDNEALDQRTADAFSKSWNNLPEGSVHTLEQFEEWLDMAPPRAGVSASGPCAAILPFRYR